ncbi:Trypsin-like peptidase domain protein [uncultured archaeon]|nr:Trypsin-like peptidase domain protein [uncultured archaeon]
MAIPASVKGFQDQIVSVVDKTKPSVVNISTVRIMQDQFLHVHPVQGVGTGVIVDEAGYVVTNFHVIAGANQVTVTLSDGRKPKGKIIGADPSSDIALIKIEADGLKAAPMADSARLKVGQLVIAIGNPFGILLPGAAATTGIVSALNRTINAEGRTYENLIQTDAAINPGNSGGPLLDIEGRVIGINSAMIPFAQGIGFAIPIDHVKEIIDDIAKFGHVRRLWLGIIAMPNRKEVAQYYNLPTDRGVIAARIVLDGPAHIAGISPGDILLEVGGVRLKEVIDIKKALKGKKPGDKVEARIVHAGETISVAIRLKEQPTQ